MRPTLHFPGNPHVLHISHASGVALPGQTTGHPISQISYDNTDATSVFEGRGITEDVGLGEEGVTGDVQGGDEFLLALYPPSAGDALQGWRKITEGQVINVIEAWLTERTASAAGSEADEDMAKYLNGDKSDSEVVEASTTIVDSQECRTKPKSSCPIEGPGHAHPQIHDDSLVPAGAYNDTSMNDSVAIRDVLELVVEAKTVSRPADSVDDKGSPLAIEANDVWPGDDSREVEPGPHSSEQSSSTSTDPSPAITDLLCFSDVSRDATPVTPDYSIETPSVEPAPLLPKPSHAGAHTRLDHSPASSFGDVQIGHKDVPVLRPVEVSISAISPNMQRDDNRPCAPQAGSSKKRTAAPYEQDDEGCGPAAAKRIRHISVVPRALRLRTWSPAPPVFGHPLRRTNSLESLLMLFSTPGLRSLSL